MRLAAPLRTSWVGPGPSPTLGGVFQPLNNNLTLISALTTTSFGRGLLTMADAAATRTAIGAGTSSFDGAFSSLSGKPTTIGGYGITDFNSLGDARWQAGDAGLTALAALTGTNTLYYRSATNTWSPVKIAAGLNFASGKLTVVTKASQLLPTSADVLASASTLVLTGNENKQVDVTGSTPITAITLADGEEAILRFTGATTLTAGALLETPGGESITTSAGGWAQVRGGAGGLVTVLSYQDADDYSRQTFDNVYIKEGGNIGYNATSVSGRFSVGSFDPDAFGTGGSYWMFTAGGNPALVSQDDFGIQASFRLSLMTSSANFLWPDVGGTDEVVTRQMAQSLTNKKLGSLTTNGLVRTSGSDGTLSVDTATYLTSAAIGVSVQAYDADLTTWAGITPASGIGTFLATPSSANLITAITDETGSGLLVFNNGPTFIAPILGTPASGVATNLTGTAASLTAGNATKLTTGRTLAITGDLAWTSPSFDGSGNVTAAGTIANSAVTLAKMANMATASLIYRKTGGSGAPEVNSLATLKTDLGVASGDATAESNANTYTDNAISAIAIATGIFGGGAANIANATSLTNYDAQYVKTANIVTVSGKVDVTFSVVVPTLVQFRLDIPIASTFANDYELGGSGSGNHALVGVPVTVYAEVPHGSAEFEFVATSALGGSLSIFYTYSYIVI